MIVFHGGYNKSNFKTNMLLSHSISHSLTHSHSLIHFLTQSPSLSLSISHQHSLSTTKNLMSKPHGGPLHWILYWAYFDNTVPQGGQCTRIQECSNAEFIIYCIMRGLVGGASASNFIIQMNLIAQMSF